MTHAPTPLNHPIYLLQRGKDTKARVLLVDDNFDMREYVARLLSTKYEVISAANGTPPPPPREVMHLRPLSTR